MSDIFGSDTIVPSENESSVSLEDLVGEGKKYKDPNELAKAYHHADSYIEDMKAQLAELKAADKVKTDLLNARQTQSTSTVEENAPRNEPPVEPNPPKVETPDIQKLVREELNSANEQKRKADNINAAAETLNRVYGSAAKAQEAIRAKAAEIGVSFDWLKNVAETSPAALYRTMEISPDARSNSTVGYSNEVVLPSGARSDVKDFKYYENLRKTSPKLYHSPEMRKQMFDSAQKLGDKFYGS